MREGRILQQLDKMISTGQVSPDEARQLRSAEGSDEFETIIRRIRTRHASARLDEAVTDGTISRHEADEQLRRLEQGEHPKGLRARLRNHRQDRSR